MLNAFKTTLSLLLAVLGAVTLSFAGFGLGRLAGVFGLDPLKDPGFLDDAERASGAPAQHLSDPTHCRVFLPELF